MSEGMDYTEYLSLTWPTSVILRIMLENEFLPEASFGLRLLSLAAACVCLSVRVSTHSFVHMITCDPPLFMPGSSNCYWPGPSRWNLSQKLKFTPFWTGPHHKSSIQATITKFRPEVQNTLVKITIVRGWVGGSWMFQSQPSTLHVYWSRQPRVFQHLMSL